MRRESTGDSGVSQVTPSAEVKILPLFPTATKISLPKAISRSRSNDCLTFDQLRPSPEIRISLPAETVTKRPLPKAAPVRSSKVSENRGSSRENSEIVVAVLRNTEIAPALP